MQIERTEFERRIAAALAGDAAEARRLCAVFGPHIRRAVRRLLPGRLRVQFDSADFEQAVWASLIDLPSGHEGFRGPEQFSRFLEAMAGNKVIDEMRRRYAGEKANLRREQFLEELDGNVQIADPRDATPSQHAIAGECWERMLEGQNGQVRRVLRLLRAGNSYEEVAAKTGLHPKSIQRCVRAIREGLDQ